MTANSEIKLKVKEDFSRTPGPRLEIEGDYSGEVFRNTCLLPRLQEAIAQNVLLVVDLDGTAGFGTSFLEEAFGGLIRENGISYDLVKKHVKIISDEEEYLKDDIESYLSDARKNEKK